MKFSFSRILNRLLFYVRKFFLLYIKRDYHTITVAKWYRDDKDLDMRYRFDLNEHSVVIDVGGYKGDWAEAIDNKYHPRIYIYEPIPEFYDIIKNRFQCHKNISVSCYGLSHISTTARISMAEDGSSTYKLGSETAEIKLVDIVDEMKKNGIDKVNLIKINIEGAEYDLIERLLSSGMADVFDIFLIQFHNFIPDAVVRREAIRKELSKTHSLLYDYPFVWESWQRKTGE
jgi:FkbM family methyltransferase